MSSYFVIPIVIAVFLGMAWLIRLMRKADKADTLKGTVEEYKKHEELSQDVDNHTAMRRKHLREWLQDKASAKNKSQ